MSTEVEITFLNEIHDKNFRKRVIKNIARTIFNHKDKIDNVQVGYDCHDFILELISVRYRLGKDVFRFKKYKRNCKDDFSKPTCKVTKIEFGVTYIKR